MKVNYGKPYSFQGSNLTYGASKPRKKERSHHKSFVKDCINELAKKEGTICMNIEQVELLKETVDYEISVREENGYYYISRI